MPQPLSPALATYRQHAASLFRARQHQPAPPQPTPQPPTAYSRPLFPALERYLQHARERYAARRARPSPPPRARARPASAAAALGADGAAPPALHAAPRKARWAAARARRAHRARAAPVLCRVHVDVACAIPLDVRQSARDRFLAARRELLRRAAGVRPDSQPRCVGSLLAEEETMMMLGGARGDERGFVRHVTRCQQAFLEGLSRVVAGAVAEQRGDCFEEVRKLYAGKPDELYRRKTARRYATWRRLRREEMQDAEVREMRAEHEMKRRRGHDQLLSARAAGDASFAPFLFEQAGGAYVFSSKISEAPKLRKVMVQKYSSHEDAREGVNAWEKARQAAETNPLFHTKVMNRFT